MKKLILMTAMIAVMTGKTYAQQTRDAFSFGLKIGSNFSNVYDSQGDKFTADGKYGLAAGAFLSLPLGKFIGIQPEVIYSEKGFKGSGAFLGSNYTATRTTTFIDVPILLAIKPASFLTILAGPQYSFLIKQENNFTSSLATVDQQKIFDNDNIRKNVLGLTGGVDINLSSFVIGARAGWDVQNNNGDGTSTTPRYKNVWYQATLGFRFL
jgi:Outer membrane protein beta-barrel domain